VVPWSFFFFFSIDETPALDKKAGAVFFALVGFGQVKACHAFFFLFRISSEMFAPDSTRNCRPFDRTEPAFPFPFFRKGGAGFWTLKDSRDSSFPTDRGSFWGRGRRSFVLVVCPRPTELLFSPPPLSLTELQAPFSFFVCVWEGSLF